MLNIFNNGSWMRPLNWNLHVTNHGEPCMPFSHYVRPERTTDPSTSTFPQYQKLPVELQLHILHFCDAQTLFELMRTSSTIRLEASKLFWSLPDAWYSINGGWLFGGGIPGYENYAVDFPAYAEQIEVEFEVLSLREEWEGSFCKGWIEERSFSVEERIREFWQTLQARFPRATRVVISESKVRRTGESPPHDLKLLVKMCPSRIRASASILRNSPNCTSKIERSLWQPAGMNADAPRKWEEVAPFWTRKSIILPPRKVHGPVGAYQHTNYQFNRYCRQKFATRLLLLEALEIHYFEKGNGPFTCFQTRCDAHFKQAGEWILHALNSGHDKGVIHPDKATQDLLDQQRKRVEKLLQDIHMAQEKIYKDWGKERSRKRQKAEQAFLHQLDHDSLYAQKKTGQESAMWDSYKTFLYEFEAGRRRRNQIQL